MAATARSAVGAAEIVVVVLAELLPGVGSVPAEATLAVLLMMVPPMVETTTVAVMVMVIDQTSLTELAR